MTSSHQGDFSLTWRNNLIVFSFLSDLIYLWSHNLFFKIWYERKYVFGSVNRYISIILIKRVWTFNINKSGSDKEIPFIRSKIRAMKLLITAVWQKSKWLSVDTTWYSDLGSQFLKFKNQVYALYHFHYIKANHLPIYMQTNDATQQRSIPSTVYQCRCKRTSHFVFQLLDVLQHRLQTLVSVCDLRVVLGHVVLSKLLRLHRHKDEWKEKLQFFSHLRQHQIQELFDDCPASVTSSLSRSSLSVGGIPGCFALSSSIKLWVAWSLCF